MKPTRNEEHFNWEKINMSLINNYYEYRSKASVALTH